MNRERRRKKAKECLMCRVHKSETETEKSRNGKAYFRGLFNNKMGKVNLIVEIIDKIKSENLSMAQILEELEVARRVQLSIASAYINHG